MLVNRITGSVILIIGAYWMFMVRDIIEDLFTRPFYEVKDEISDLVPPLLLFVIALFLLLYTKKKDEI